MVHLRSTVGSVLLFILFIPAILAQIQGGSPNHAGGPTAPVLPRTPDLVATPQGRTDPLTVRQKGLCRDGWSRGSIIDFSGVEIPVCMRVNPRAESWAEARDSCRQDYGFLLKLDSPAKINNVNLMSYLYDKGVRRFWTGLHTYAEHIVWDDLIPNSVRPNDLTNTSSFPTRPWKWSSRFQPVTDEPCGFLSIDDGDDKKKRRRKRAPDEDSPDGGFDLAAFQDGLYQFQRPSSKYLPTGAFQSMQSRMPLSDQLSDLPGTSLGITSDQQIPGTGLSDSNLQPGSLFTDMGAFDPTTKPDTDDKDVVNPENLGTTSIMQSDFFNGDNQNSPSDLLSSVKETAAKLQNQNSPSHDSMLDSVKEKLGLNLDMEKLGEKGVNTGTVDIPDVGSDNQKPSDDKSSILGTIGKFLLGANPGLVAETTTAQTTTGDSDQTMNDQNDVKNTDVSGTSSDDNKKPDIKIDDFNENFSGLNIENTDGKAAAVDTKPELNANVNEDMINTVVTTPISVLNSTIPMIPDANVGEQMKDLLEHIDSIASNDGLLSDIIDNAKSDDTQTILTSDDLLKPLDMLPEMPSDILPTEPNNDDTNDVPKVDESFANLDGISTDILTNDDSKLPEINQISDDTLVTEKDSHNNLFAHMILSKIEDKYFGDVNDDPNNGTHSLVTPDLTEDDNQHDLFRIPSLDDLLDDGIRSDDAAELKQGATTTSSTTMMNSQPSVDDIAEKLNDYMEHIQESTSDRIDDLKQNHIDTEVTSNPHDLSDILSNQDHILDRFDDASEIKPSEFLNENSAIEKLDDKLESFVNDIDTESNLNIADKIENIIDDGVSDHSFNTSLGDELDLEKDIKDKLYSDDHKDDHKPDHTDDNTYLHDDTTDGIHDINDTPLQGVIDAEDLVIDQTTVDTGLPDDPLGDFMENLHTTEQEEIDQHAPELSETVTDNNEMRSEIIDDIASQRDDIIDNWMPSEGETDQTHVDTDTHQDDTDHLQDHINPTTHDTDDIDSPDQRQYNTDDTELTNPRQHDQDDTEISDPTHYDKDDIDIPDQTFGSQEPVFEQEDRHNEGDSRERPDLAEDVERGDQKILIAPANQHMDLSTCNVRLPSVCFSYEVEVMTTASTCEPGWYGHVLLDTCYKILDGKLSYSNAASTCKSIGSRVALGESEFERKFVLLAVQKEGQMFRGEKFWMETTSSDALGCQYFDERGVTRGVSCNTWLSVVCVKDAKSLAVHIADASPYFNSNDEDDDFSIDLSSLDAELKLFSSRRHQGNSGGDRSLICDLTSAASEFPVLWFKDGVLVETKDKYATPDISLHLNDSLIEAFRRVTNRNITVAALQGKYWCEVWDRKTLTRKRSRPYDVRFSDVISFHGSIQLRGVPPRDSLLFNTMHEQFPRLVAIETDLRHVFSDTLGAMRLAFPHVSDVFTLVDRVRSSPSVVEYHTYYSLARDYSPADEDAIYARVKAVLKTRLGNPRYMAGLPGGTPVTTFRTMSLQSTVSCPTASLQTDVDVNGRVVPVRQFRFPKATLGDFANSFDNCSSSNGYPAGTARCLGDFSTGAYWGQVVANECLDERAIDKFNSEIWGSSPFTDKLSEIAQTVVNTENVEKIVSQVAHITEVAARLTPTDINKIADVLDHSTQVGKLPEKVGGDVLKTIDKLMSTSEKEVHVANVETKAANRIIKSLERYAETADLGNKGNVRMVSDNVVVELWDLTGSEQVIGLAAETKRKSMGTPFKDEIIATVFNKSQLDTADVDAAIELPREVFAQKEKGVSLGNRLTMMVFRKSRLFEAALSSDGKVMSPTQQQLNSLNSYVISASIAGKKLSGLKERVRTIFRPLKDRDGTRQCVWWDFAQHEGRGGWSPAGCYYDGKINGRDICLCDHLTNFAVLLDFYGQSEPIPDHHELSLSIITVLGLALSILGLALTIISYLFFRKLRKGRAQQTLSNLSLALLFSMLTFLVGIKQTHSYVGCLVVAILLHYFILVSFMWMLMEAVLQYLTFVKILGKLRKGRAQQTLFNLSLALLFSMLTFLVGIKQTHSYVGCLVVAILLHYFILVSFMWMLMEAVLQYLTFVKILGKLRKGRAQQTLFNLSLALLFSMLTFLVGIKQTHSYVGCLVVAILLHYFILVSFMWMLMEAVLQYLTFVKILGTYITRFTLKTVLPAWGLPLIPVIAVLSVDFHLYHGGPNYCWMDLPAFYFAFAIPVTCIIAINVVIFFITIVSIFRRGKGLRSNQKKQKMAMTNLQAAITSFILLGLTWVFGYLAISDARLPFQYVFTILNSLQGFFIFILFVVRKKKVRDQWYIICCRGGEKDRVSRSLSASNSIPSSYSNGSNRNSKHERDRSDSTKTTQSTYSNSSGGFTNYGYDHGYEVPYTRPGRRFRKF